MDKLEPNNREVWIDWMRLAACFMVVVTHCTEPFYLGGEGSLILTKADAFWVAGFCVFTRAAVALFVVASSYLQFPLHYSPGEFFPPEGRKGPGALPPLEPGLCACLG